MVQKETEEIYGKRNVRGKTESLKNKLKKLFTKKKEKQYGSIYELAMEWRQEYLDKVETWKECKGIILWAGVIFCTFVALCIDVIGGLFFIPLFLLGAIIANIIVDANLRSRGKELESMGIDLNGTTEELKADMVGSAVVGISSAMIAGHKVKNGLKEISDTDHWTKV